MEEFMDRKDIEEKYTWDLSQIYNSIDSFYSDLNKAKDLVTQLSKSKDTFLNSKEECLKFHEDYNMLDRLANKLYCFAHLHCDVEPTNQEYQTLLSTILSFFNELTVQLDFYSHTMINHYEIVSEYIQDEMFKDYKYSIEEVLREKDHILSQEIETILSKTYNISDTSEKVFDALRLEYDDVEVNGEMKTLNSATLSEFLKNKNPEVRKTAYHNFFKEYKKYENVYATTLSGVMQKDAFYADVRKFESPLHASLFNDNVPTDLFFKILDKANKQYRPLFHRYNRLKKKVLNLDVMHNYDLSVPLVENIDKKYTIEQCFDTIFKSLEPLGEDYLKIIRKAKDERWIDYYPTKGKRIGAYSSGCYDTNPYILMNFIGDYNSMSTMIHELGHSAHTYLSNQNQHSANASYRIFVAEVASTVNETFLINYMLNNSETKEEKAYFLYELLENCVGLIFRQPMYAEFEHTLHTWAKDHIPMSAQTITELYDKINDEYYGEDVVNDELVGHSCFYVPHYYYNYYVYKYTLGMTVALAIVSRILDGDHQQVKYYLNFLKSGGSKSPVDLLKSANVDPLDDSIYDDAFHYFEKILNQFEELILAD
jgi:oligoendopeptidase F